MKSTTSVPEANQARASYLRMCWYVVGDFVELWTGEVFDYDFMKGAAQFTLRFLFAVAATVFSPIVIPIAAYLLRKQARRQLAASITRNLRGRSKEDEELGGTITGRWTPSPNLQNVGSTKVQSSAP